MAQASEASTPPPPAAADDDAALTAPPWGAAGRSATLAAVAALSKLVLTGLNTLDVRGGAAFEAAVLRRPPGQGLVTVCNHTSTADDPALLSAMLPLAFYATEHAHGRVRWSLCAREICYRNAALGAFFKSGKTLPIERGRGLDQPAMAAAAARVGAGEWAHVFPEGRVVYTGRLGPLRWGVGRLVCDAALASPGGAPPLVVPFYHSGMGRVLPRGARAPRAGRVVVVEVGDPVPVADLACGCGAASEAERRAAWRAITERVGAALRALEARAPPNAAQEGTPEGALPAMVGAGAGDERG